jgi:hypothetical protein
MAFWAGIVFIAVIIATAALVYREWRHWASPYDGAIE